MWIARKPWALVGIALMLPACSDDDAKVSDLDRLIAEVRSATDHYHDVGVAESDGYQAEGLCANNATGTMGTHYVNSALLSQPLRVEAPATLLFVGTPPRLVGVEYTVQIIQDGMPYIAPEVPPRADSVPPPPELFPAQPFDGPMAGHTSDRPWHYDQHVWVWEENPRGMFEKYNPNLTCD